MSQVTLAQEGATGIVAPVIESADDARRLMSLAHYPPSGDRSAAHYTRSLYYSNVSVRARRVDFP